MKIEIGNWKEQRKDMKAKFLISIFHELLNLEPLAPKERILKSMIFNNTWIFTVNCKL